MYIVIDDEKERFIDLKYPGIDEKIYMISNYAGIYNKKTGKLRDIQALDRDGYVRGPFKTPAGDTIYAYIHRTVAYNFCKGFEPISGRVYVNHIDSIREHNYYKNLEWVTQAENTLHSFRHGSAKPHINHLVGEANGMCRYSDEFTHKVCMLLDIGISVPNIMKEFGYNKCQDNLKLYDFIRYVMNGKYRTNVSSQYNFYKKAQRLSKG